MPGNENLRQDVSSLFTEPVSLTYLSGMEGLEGAVLERTDELILLTDPRYLEEARSRFPGEVRGLEGSLEDAMKEIAREKGITGMCFEGEMPFWKGQRLTAALKETGVSMEGAAGLLRSRRMVKRPEEQDLIRKSAEITDSIFADALTYIREGIREKELSRKLEISILEHQGDGSSFPLMALFGSSASKPHGTPGDQPLEWGMPVLLDIGSRYRGYASDMTRMLSLGDPGGDFRQHYDFLLELQVRAVAMVRPGASARDIHEYVSGSFAEAGLQVLHSTGHGVGLEIHEAPYLGKSSTDKLEAGMVLTIEPGLYLPGRYGMRIEDLVLVTPEGCEILSKTPKELIIL